MRTSLVVEGNIEVPAERSSFHVVVLPSSYPTFHSPINGIFVREQVHALRRAGIRSGVVYPDLRSLRTFKAGQCANSHFQTEANQEQGVTTLRISAWNVPFFNLGWRLWVRFAIRGFSEYVARFGKPDLCHAHNSLWAGAAAFEIRKRFGVPYIITEHSSAYERQLVNEDGKSVTRDVFAQSSAIIAVSRWLRDKLQHYTTREIRVVPNSVDTEFFTLPLTPRRAGVFRFLTVALLTPVKGIDVLIKAFARLLPNENNIELEIAGDGPERVRLEDLTNRLGISSSVIFSGERSREEVRQSMWRSNAFVTASHTETFGVVLAEALATGLPVISTKCGGPEEMVSADTGMLVERNSESALADALTRMSQNRGKYDEHHQRQTVILRYSESVVVNQLQQVYRSALCR